jgi:hypothetical protein
MLARSGRISLSLFLTLEFVLTGRDHNLTPKAGCRGIRTPLTPYLRAWCIGAFRFSRRKLGRSDGTSATSTLLCEARISCVIIGM